ncbi:hypothetical protein K469DRAFT_705543 [Zopfia rhizophila CBS 207.26]|uniref:Dpy-30 domain-containing protein n=1 Tax=Zopfia rhizophila CBS 207.26 TaxID=1314779 RepID=A0A6A6E5A2_9PEZI|nr:hypothetical protein K469DRAFT_705543 [Zopfia rhizophila CBS 207.26]
MAEPSPTPHPTADAEPVPNGTSVDVEMKEESAIEQTPQPAAVQTPTHPTSHPTATHTPTRNSPHPSAPQTAAPDKPNLHGSSTRMYLNQNVTPYLLEAMKHLATMEPQKPLKWLSEYLAEKSLEVEGP